MNYSGPIRFSATFAEMARCLKLEMIKLTPTCIDPAASASANSQRAAAPTQFSNAQVRGVS